MMTKKKRLLIIILVTVAIISMIIAGIVFVIVKTDLLKSDEQLFYKYLFQDEKIGKLIDHGQLDPLIQKMENTPYKNAGEITFNGKQMQNGDILSQSKIQFSGNTDQKSGNKSQVISLINNDKTYFELKFLKTGNLYGLKSDEVVNKYIAVENNNLQELIKKIQGTNQNNGINHIAFPNIEILKNASKEDKEEIKELLKSVVHKSIPANNYQTKKNIEVQLDGESIITNQYSVSISETEYNNLMISLLETIKQNETSMKLLNEVLDHQIEKEVIEEWMDKAITDYKKKDISEEAAIWIGIFEKNGEKLLTEVNIKETKIQIQNKETEEVYLSIIQIEDAKQDKYQKIEVEKLKNSLEYNIAVHDYKEQKEVAKTIAKFKIDIIEDNNIETSFIIGRNDGKQIIQVNYKNKKDFVDQLDVEELNGSNSVTLNNYPTEKMQNLLGAIQNRLTQLFIERMSMIVFGENVINNY